MNNNISILSTAQLEQPLINKAMQEKVHLDMIPFIQVVDITDDSKIQEQLARLYKQRATVVFTSTNAVYAVCETPAFRLPDWDIYCIKNATLTAVLEYFDNEQVMGISDDAAELANVIQRNKDIKEVLFFCGDKRMDTLPQTLKKNKIKVNEVVVYETVEQPVFVERDYNGILFFSPTAVNSYFSLNIADPNTVLFAIGKTTEQAIREQSMNKVVVSNVQTKAHVLTTAIDYLKLHTVTKQL